MSSDNPIEITMKIPFPIDKPDRNGMIYTKEAVEGAVEMFTTPVPLLISLDGINDMVNIGYIDKVELSKDYEITARGLCYYGGSNENADGDKETKTIKTFQFTAFGLCNK